MNTGVPTLSRLDPRPCAGPAATPRRRGTLPLARTCNVGSVLAFELQKRITSIIRLRRIPFAYPQFIDMLSTAQCHMHSSETAVSRQRPTCRVSPHDDQNMKVSRRPARGLGNWLCESAFARCTAPHHVRALHTIRHILFFNLPFAFSASEGITRFHAYQ